MNEFSPTVRRIVGPTMLLFSGEYFDLLAPETSSFAIEDIAHGLAMTCRFGGQCRRYYSVAEHSVHTSRAVSKETAFAALMHDAHEAFVGDVIKPLKDILPDYRAVEDRIEAAVLARFGLNLPLPAEVVEADVAMLATEQVQLMRNRDDWDYTRGRKPLPVMLQFWSPEEAKYHFLARFHEIKQTEGR